MRISVNWLRDYVEFSSTVEELAQRLTMAGLEVERVDLPGEALRGVVVAQIMESVPHPNAEKLSVTRVNSGGSTLIQVVCGAKNYRVGDKVPLAIVGTTLPNGAQIGQANLRGVESSGMLCSAKELGLSDDASGLLILDPAAKPGSPLAQALGLDDAVLELDVTPNRPDALCHLGIAREISVLTHAALRTPQVTLSESGSLAANQVRIRIEDASRCLRYAARLIDGVKIAASPDWLAHRLEACGMRAINNVVDVTNYVMLEYGQPLHGFDFDRIAGGEIIVRLARPGEKLTTLDEKERILDPDDLLICDRDKPLVLAGVMGGTQSEVGPATRRILLESANFQATGVRRTSKRHGLHTESSHRFERGLDVNGLPAALDRAASLIAELAGGTVLKGCVDVYPRPVQLREVTLRYERVGELLGAPVPSRESHEILDALGFKRRSGEGTAAAIYTVPGFRVDVEREEDLIEEVARIRGYDAIPDALPRGVSELPSEPAATQAERQLRLAMAAAGFHEVLNYSFVSPKDLEAIEAEPGIALKNPLTIEQSVMRTSLHAGLLQNLSKNLRHHADSVRLYELGRVYKANPRGGSNTMPPTLEPLRVAGVLWGSRQGRTWTTPAAPIDFFDAKGAVETLLAGLRVQGVTFEATSMALFHPRAAVEVRARDGSTLGVCGELHPRIAQRLELPPSVFLFDLDAPRLYELAELIPRVKALARYPAVLRDLAVVVPIGLDNEQVRQVILEVGTPLVDDAIVFDVYTGKPLPEGLKNLAYAIRYRSAERTLTDTEVNQAHQKIVQEVHARLGGELR